MRAALSGVDAAWYLVHSMDDRPDFEQRDRDAATTFAEAAAKEGVSRIVYLGGLHPDDEELSPHLASRVEVGQIFLDAPVPAAVLQAAVVLGDGSASFDMLRYLTTRLPAMVAPKWLDNKIQPIAVDDVLTLLAGAGELPPEVNRTFDIGGDEVLTYREMIARFSDATGRRRPFVVTVPVLTPRLASHWVGLVTPISAGLAKPLVGSLVHEVVAKERDIDDYVEVPGGYIDFDDGGAVGDAHGHARHGAAQPRAHLGRDGRDRRRRARSRRRPTRGGIARSTCPPGSRRPPRSRSSGRRSTPTSPPARRPPSTPTTRRATRRAARPTSRRSAPTSRSTPRGARSSGAPAAPGPPPRTQPCSPRAPPISPAGPGSRARAPASPCPRMPCGAVSRPSSPPRSPAATPADVLPRSSAPFPNPDPVRKWALDWLMRVATACLACFSRMPDTRASRGQALAGCRVKALR